MKIAFAVAAAFLILAQTLFIAVMRGSKTLVYICEKFGIEPSANIRTDIRDGATRMFLDAYSAFGVEPSAYAKFMFSIMPWWWILPSAWAIRRWSGKRAALVLFANAISLCVLIMAPYSTLARMSA
ncbi:MAG: hypothetical protein LBU11_12955 [Zoogloeaceae bacterium]|nr:hypothetical protein [Zoogloeaceae bacterium]